jgi:hypothetical protein
MSKSVVNPVTGNTVTFSGGEYEADIAMMRDEAMEQEYRYEQACFAVGVVPFSGSDRFMDGDLPFDQPEG